MFNKNLLCVKCYYGGHYRGSCKIYHSISVIKELIIYLHLQDTNTQYIKTRQCLINDKGPVQIIKVCGSLETMMTIREDCTWVMCDFG